MPTRIGPAQRIIEDIAIPIERLGIDGPPWSLLLPIVITELEPETFISPEGVLVVQLRDKLRRVEIHG